MCEQVLPQWYSQASQAIHKAYKETSACQAATTLAVLWHQIDLNAEQSELSQFL